MVRHETDGGLGRSRHNSAGDAPAARGEAPGFGGRSCLPGGDRQCVLRDRDRFPRRPLIPGAWTNVRLMNPRPQVDTRIGASGGRGGTKGARLPRICRCRFRPPLGCSEECPRGVVFRQARRVTARWHSRARHDRAADLAALHRRAGLQRSSSRSRRSRRASRWCGRPRTPSRLCSRAISRATNQFSMYHVDDLDRGNRTPLPPRRGSA
jgi:hypothetical protein